MFGLVITGTDLYLARLVKLFVEGASQGYGSGSPGQLQGWTDIQRVALILVFLQIPKGIATYSQSYLVASATNRIAATLREEIYAHLHRLSLSFFERSKVGHIISRMTNDVGLIQNSAGSLVDAVTSPLIIIGGICRMFWINWMLALVALLFVPGIGVVISKVTRRMRKLATALQVKLADVSAVIDETIAGIRIVKSFGAEAHEVAKFCNTNTASLRAALRAARRNAMAVPVGEMFSSVAVAIIVLVGGYLMVVKNVFQFSDFAEFIVIGFYVSSSAKRVGRLNVAYHQTMAGMERVFEVLDEQPDIVDSQTAIDIGAVQGRVEFRNVDFSYQTGEQVLQKVSFAMEPGEVVAVVGRSGSGKSTLASLIPRFYDVSDGAVLIDDHDVRDVTRASIRKHIGIVPQEAILFSGTIRDNIAYGAQNASDAEIVAAARAANAHDFISSFENGYQTIVGERGTRLSGGEKQRVSIARALLKDPRILILDEATSSLDTASEQLVQAALDVLMQGRTTLMIAHRLSTITKADKVIVMDGGRIVEQGKFDDLVSQGGAFSDLHSAQFGFRTAGVSLFDEGNSEQN